MKKTRIWALHPKNKITLEQRLLSLLSVKVREDQFKLFWELMRPKPYFKILDVGTRPDERLSDSNFFERRYPFLENLTAVSVEDCRKLFKKKYPEAKFIQVIPQRSLPFSDKSFDIVVSWATLEHVGKREEQKFFLDELFRVGGKLFITTPNKSCFYEPHSGLLFVHWLPHRYFSLVCRLLRKSFWAYEANLNPLSV